MVSDEEFLKPKTLKIGDIVKNKGRFLSHREFQRKFNRRINWLKLHSVTLAIPTKWRQLLVFNDETWKKLFLLPKFTTYNNKITMLQ